MARALTSGELSLLRSNGQRSQLYLAIQATPSVVFSARVNQTITATDDITELLYTGALGTLSNVLPGMTLWIGSSAGAFDKGQARIRKAPDSSKIYIGRQSEINFANGDYLTVVDEFGLWPRHWLVYGTVPYLDQDVEYSDQHAKPDPVPVLGPDWVVWLSGASVSIQPDASGSWLIDGSAISSYSWSASGASITGSATATPTITYTAAGQYRISCTVTAVNGKTATGHRSVFVFDANHPPITAFQLQDCAGDWESGGWSFSVTLWADAGLTTVRDRTKVILFARDWYGSTEQSIGPIPGRENIIASGWIEGDSIEWDPEQGSVTFTVQGPAWWLDQMVTFPLGMDNVTSDPTDWLHYKNLTMDAFCWRLLHWHSTATAVIDVILSGDTRLASGLNSPLGSIWQQLSLADTKILARPLCDRYGRLFVEIDPQFTPTVSRSSIPVVHAIEKGDWHGSIQIERRTLPVVSMLDLSGVAYDGSTATALFSLANGNIFKRFGLVEKRDELILADQDQANELAGLILAQTNADYPHIDVNLAANHRMIDICPRQYCTLTVAASDTPRGISFTNKRIIPRTIRFEHDPESGSLLTAASFEGETTGDLAITVTYTDTAIDNTEDQPDTDSTWPITPNPDTWTTPVIPTIPDLSCVDEVDPAANGPYRLYIAGVMRSDDTVPYRSAYYKCYLRPGTVTNKTKVYLEAKWEVSTDNGATWQPWLTIGGFKIEAVNNIFGVEAQATLEAVTDQGQGKRGGSFSPADWTPVLGFKFSLSPDGVGLATFAQEYVGANPSDSAYPIENTAWTGAMSWKALLAASSSNGWDHNAIWLVTGLPTLPDGHLEYKVKCLANPSGNGYRVKVQSSEVAGFTYAPTLSGDTTGYPNLPVGNTSDWLLGTRISAGVSGGSAYMRMDISDNTSAANIEIEVVAVRWVSTDGLTIISLFEKGITRVTMTAGWLYNICTS